jgi:hypothetical protein
MLNGRSPLKIEISIKSIKTSEHYSPRAPFIAKTKLTERELGEERRKGRSRGRGDKKDGLKLLVYIHASFSSVGGTERSPLRAPLRLTLASVNRVLEAAAYTVLPPAPAGRLPFPIAARRLQSAFVPRPIRAGALITSRFRANLKFGNIKA